MILFRTMCEKMNTAARNIRGDISFISPARRCSSSECLRKKGKFQNRQYMSHPVLFYGNENQIFIALMTSAGLSDLKTALPATRISAPAITRGTALSGHTPPSISILTSRS